MEAAQGSPWRLQRARRGGSPRVAQEACGLRRRGEKPATTWRLIALFFSIRLLTKRTTFLLGISIRYRAPKNWGRRMSISSSPSSLYWCISSMLLCFPYSIFSRSSISPMMQ